MKKKIVLWGNDANDEKVLIALELLAKESQVNVHTFKQDIVTEVFYNLMMDDWRQGKEVEFPEGSETAVRELSVTDDILPDTLKVQRTDLINRAKAEWHFVVLSTKMYDLYQTELEDLKERIEKLVDFDGGIWEEVKGFWGKVSEQARERNLFRDHADKLKNETNNLFTKMKEFKTKANEELSKVSKERVAQFTTRLDDVKDRVDQGKSLSPLFEELKKIQSEFKTAEFTRNDRNKVWKRIDEAFKKVKEKKYGKQPEGQAGAASRLDRRYQGLMSAIGKMQQSINRDKKDIEFQTKRVNETSGQLEMQIRQAKVKMIEERIQSKQDKLNEMAATQKELQKRMEKEKEREAKRAEKKEIEKKKEEVKEKIQAEIAQTKVSEEEAAKLEKAAGQINKKPKKAKKESAPDAEAKATAAPAEDAKADITVESSKVSSKEVKASADAPKTETPSATLQTEELKADAPETEAKQDAPAEEAKPAAPVEKETLFGAAATILGDAVEDMVDSVKAVASVVTDKVEDAVEDLTESKDETKSAALTDDKTTSDAKGALAKGGLLAGAVALGSKLVKDASDKIDTLSEDLGLDDTIDKAKETLQESKEAISEKVDSVSDKVTDKVADAKAEVTETKEEAKAELAEETKTEAKEATEEAEPEKGGLGGMMAKGGLLGAAVALGSKVIETVTDKVEEVAEDLGIDDKLDQAKEALTGAKESAEQSVDEVADRVRQETKADSSEEE